jgi:hypothetical protein
MDDATQEMVDERTSQGQDCRVSYVQTEPVPWKKYREYTIKLTLPYNSKLDTAGLGIKFLRSGAVAVEFEQSTREDSDG